MHLGNARTALLAWLSARRAGGQMVLRLEDLDRERVVAGAEERLYDELRWLGLDWDEGPDLGGPHAPYRQSERAALYDAAVKRLLEADRAFLCACSRADVARAAAAPHGEDGLRYPGTCRELSPADVRARAAAGGRAPAVRFRGERVVIDFEDQVHGLVSPLDKGVDDFLIRRADGTAAYQLAVVVDDAAMGITQVLRGDDLLASTPRQLALYRALALPEPRFAHVPLVLSPAGERLAKRNRPRAVRDLRRAGVVPEAVVGALASSAGLRPVATPTRPVDLLERFDLRRLPRAPVVVSIPARTRPRR
jgi:glutamyl-tRNA synthetase